MRTLIAFTSVMIVCAGPAFAQAGRLDGNCGDDPETTGALSADPRSLYLPGERPTQDQDTVEITPPEESWQEAAREDAERRRRGILACGVD
ncbi:hypothetical protein R1A27_30175 (plasmid) [Methylobacterium sp. NMS12]|uniref:hypothetical protein n=1 Tax=Methylobacterium sp. NMS12 TaxID=3079766 RepID=UPI003F882BE2